MSKLFVMVGLPGSGKSTYATKLTYKHNAKLLSSDNIRFELFGNSDCQENNNLVFETLHKRLREFISNGDNVIVDACNINIKSRRKMLNSLSKLKCEKTAVVMSTPINICIENDKNRDRIVGEEVIKKFLYRFEIPMFYEGFENIDIVKYENNKRLEDLNEIYTNCIGFNQNNPHHKHTLEYHLSICQTTANYLSFPLEEPQQQKNDILCTAAILHDIGKLFTQTTDENGISHYYSHHNVGAYKILTSKQFYEKISNKNFMASNNWLKIIWLVNFHMNPYFWKYEKTRDKYLKLFGNELYDMLMILHNADKNSK